MEDRVTTQEVLEKTFSKKFNGYDPVEVDEFLDDILKTMEDMEQELARYPEGGEKETYKPQGPDFGDVLNLGGKQAAALVEQAEARAQEIMSATTANATMIVESAQNRAKELSEEARRCERRIRDLRLTLYEFTKDQIELFDQKIERAYTADQDEKPGLFQQEEAKSEYDRAMSRSDEFLRTLRNEEMERVPHVSSLIGSMQDGGESR